MKTKSLSGDIKVNAFARKRAYEECLCEPTTQKRFRSNLADFNALHELHIGDFEIVQKKILTLKCALFSFHQLTFDRNLADFLQQTGAYQYCEKNMLNWGETILGWWIIELLMFEPV